MLERPNRNQPARLSLFDTAAGVFEQLRARIGNDMFLRGAGWLSLAQVAGRICRLLTTLVVARVLAPEHFGLAAIALASNEIAHIVARFGTSACIVQCREEELERHTHTAYYLNWVIGIGLFLIQCAAAWPIALWYDRPDLILPICLLGVTYLLLPLGGIHAALNQRNGDLDALARGDVYQAAGDTVLTIIMAATGFGVWALILPKVLVVPLWIIPQRRKVQFKPRWPVDRSNVGTIVRFGYRVLGVELLTVFRLNIDVIIVGSVLGVQALGIYFFALNAGLGITRSLLGALSNALFPSLCDSRDDIPELNRRFARGLALICAVIIPWVIFQSVMASWYVPIIFGQKWVDYGALPVLMTFCFVGIPLAFNEAGAQYLRARGFPQLDLRWYLPFTIMYMAAIAIGIQWGILGVALSVLIVYAINVPCYYLVNIHPLMRQRAIDETTPSLSDDSAQGINHA